MFASGLFVGIINLVTQIYFARVLGVALIADYAKIAVSVGIVAIATSFGINQALIGVGFSIRRFHNCVTLTLIQVILTALIFVALVYASFAVGLTDINRLVRPACLAFLGTLFLLPAHTLNAEFECKLEYSKLAWARALSFLGANACIVALSMILKNDYTMPARDFLNGLLYLIISLSMRRCPIGFRFDKKVCAALMSYAKDIWLNNLLSEGAKRWDYALVGMVLPGNSFGIYFQVRKLFEGVLGFLVYPIGSTVFSYLRQERDRFDFQSSAMRLLVLAGCGAAGSAIVANLVGQKALITLLGPRWAEGGAVVVPLAVYSVLVIYLEIFVAMSKATNSMRAVHIARIGNVALICLLVPILGSFIGIKGAAWATALASIFTVLVAIPRKETRLQ
jgi:O-antigen/teichoic acid export membrane protein